MLVFTPPILVTDSSSGDGFIQFGRGKICSAISLHSHNEYSSISGQIYQINIRKNHPKYGNEKKVYILWYGQRRYSKPPLLLLEMSGQLRNVSSFTGFQIAIEGSCSSLVLSLSFSPSKQVYKDQLESADRIVHWLALLGATGYICALFCLIDQSSLHFQHTQTKIRKNKKLMKNTNNTNKVPIVQILLHWIKHFLTQ